MRKPLIAGNWKMHKTMTEAVALAQGVKKEVLEVDTVEVVVAPPFTALHVVFQSLQGSHISLAAQDLFYEAEGAYTGEISPEMLKDAGCRYVIVGHSERRALFGETDAIVKRKIRAALQSGLSPILCVGESLEERETGKTFDVLDRQLKGALAGCSDDDLSRIVMAYEPIWAIGTGKTATPEQANEVHSHVRNVLSELLNTEIAAKTRILYGGSVKPSNARDLMAQPDIDGALVGGASLAPESFSQIVRSCEAI